MKFHSVHISGCRNISLNNKRSLRLDLSGTNIHMVLGTNGSGKSSLLRNVSVFPPNPADFKKDLGNISISLEHNNNLYTLSADFSSGNSYSFVKNGEVLNDRGTQAVQKQLVLTEFGVDKSVNDLMHGDFKFTLSTPTERRAWFTKIASSDYSYALSLYKKLVDEHRDITGALKYTKGRIVQETASRLNAEDIQKLTEQTAVLKSLLLKKLEEKTTSTKTSFEIKDKLLETKSDIVEVLRKIKMLSKEYITTTKFGGTNDVFILEESISDTKGSISFLNRKTEQLSTEILELQAKLESSLSLGSTSEEDILRDLDILIKEQNRLRSYPELGVEFSNLDISHTALTAASVEISDVLLDIPANDSRYFTREKAAQLSQRYSELSSLKTELENQRSHYDHILRSPVSKCPACEHIWHPESELSETELKLKLFKVIDDLEGTQKEFDSVAEELERIKDYLDKVRRYYHFTSGYPNLLPLWDYIDSKSLIQDSPSSISGIINELRLELEIKLECRKLESQQRELEDTLRKVRLLRSEDVTQLNARLGVLDSELYNALTDRNSAINKLDSDSLVLRLVKNAAVLQKELLELNRGYNLLLGDYINSIMQDELAKEIYEFKIKVNELERQLNTVELKENLISDLCKTESVQIERLSNLKVLMDELSPTSGLIAESMLSSIEYYVAKMNRFINSMWLYPLEIMKPSISEEDGFQLDFKFPLLVDERNLVSDISKGSDSMLEIVDLAFRLTVLEALKLNDVLFLDEFGRGFDTLHRSSSYGSLRTYIDSRGFNNVFIVNHYRQLAESFHGAAYNVLDDRNIDLPQGVKINEYLTLS